MRQEIGLLRQLAGKDTHGGNEGTQARDRAGDSDRPCAAYCSYCTLLQVPDSEAEQDSDERSEREARMGTPREKQGQAGKRSGLGVFARVGERTAAGIRFERIG